MRAPAPMLKWVAAGLGLLTVRQFIKPKAAWLANVASSGSLAISATSSVSAITNSKWGLAAVADAAPTITVIAKAICSMAIIFDNNC